MVKVSTSQERLNQLFDADPRTDTAIGEALGVSKQTISAWRNGTRSPKRSMLMTIAEYYNTTVEWLLGWDAPSPDPAQNASILTADEQALLAAYRAADDRAREDALNTLLTHPREVKRGNLA